MYRTEKSIYKIHEQTSHTMITTKKIKKSKEFFYLKGIEETEVEFTCFKDKIHMKRKATFKWCVCVFSRVLTGYFL